MDKILGPKTVKQIVRIALLKKEWTIKLSDRNGEGIDFPSASGRDDKFTVADQETGTRVAILIAHIVGARLEIERHDDAVVLWRLEKLPKRRRCEVV